MIDREELGVLGFVDGSSEAWTSLGFEIKHWRIGGNVLLSEWVDGIFILIIFIPKKKASVRGGKKNWRLGVGVIISSINI